MGYALFVTFDHSIPNTVGWDMCGKTLARNIDKLDDTAKQLNLIPLSEMISMKQEDLEDILDDVIETNFEEQWFHPSKGLITVDGLTTFVRENPEQFDQISDLLEDLITLKEYLSLAEQYNSLFHLTLDF